MNDLELLSNFSLFLKEKKEKGVKIIAFLAHDNIPEELLDAAGFFPLRLIFGGNDDLMNASHDYLPPSTCAFAQTCIGLFSIKPAQFDFLDLIDYFIVSNHCVSDICASEIISKYYNIPRLDFYVPYTNNKNSSDYFKLELRDLKQKLEEIIKKEVDNESIFDSIKKYNNFKKKLSEINSLEITGSEKLKVIQKALLYGPSFLLELEQYIEKNISNPIEKIEDSKNVLITGCSIFINDYLIELIEDGGGNIVFFDTWIGNHYYSQILEEEMINTIKDPLDLLVYRFENNRYGDHSVPNFLENKLLLIEKYYQSYKQKTGKGLGIINHIIKFCDHISLMSSYLKERLQKQGIRVLNLERDYSRANRGQLSTRIEAFLEMI
ncbi:MAG: 2-hydroxyacyl-CoA dehydratase subunit D [Candidatus Hodarchaeota archaeon]